MTYKIELAPIETKPLQQFVTDYSAFDKEVFDLSDSIRSAFADIAIGFGESIGELIAGTGNLSGFTNKIAEVFANMAIQVGKIAIQLGVVMMAIEGSLGFKNPFTAIAAGIALVALGTAVKASLSKVASGGGTSGSSSSYSDTLDVRSNRSEERSSREVNLNVSGEFKLQGNTLVAAINKENRRKNLTT